ncbi:hypothetical protein DHX103_03380 [Planococcus sp. X10-3]|uniref:hypothetical protein n=1 Tax=Planococcus sp. X10-3 TaxID=3061240 RepID=UPI003BAE6FBB
MKCSYCQHEQDTGKFCGKCGTVLTAHEGTNAGPTASVSQDQTTAYATAAPVYQAPTEPNQHVEKVKATSKQYWTYFIQYIKNPGSIVEQPGQQLVNALITMAIFALIFSLAVYKNLKVIVQPFEDMGGFFGSSASVMPSFFSVLFTSVLSLGLIFILAAGCLYLVNKFAGPEESFTNIITSFGTLMIPSVVVLLAAYLLLLIDSLTFGNVLLLLSISLSVSLAPLYLITVLLKKSGKALDSFYAYLAYVVLFSISMTILMSVFFDSTIGRYIEEFGYLF